MNLIEVLRKFDGTWVMADFGISVRRLTGQLKSTSRCRMSAETCAPEIMKEHPKYDEYLDIWAAGCVAYFTATGNHLFPHTKSYRELDRLFERLTQAEVPTISIGSKLLVNIGLAHPLTPDKVFAPILT